MRDNDGGGEETVMICLGTGVPDGTLTGPGVGARTGGSGSGNGGGGNEGVDVEIVSEIRVRSLGLVNREGLGRITDVSNDSSRSSCRETERENGVGWRWVES